MFFSPVLKERFVSHGNIIITFHLASDEISIIIIPPVVNLKTSIHE